MKDLFNGFITFNFKKVENKQKIKKEIQKGEGAQNSGYTGSGSSTKPLYRKIRERNGKFSKKNRSKRGIMKRKRRKRLRFILKI